MTNPNDSEELGRRIRALRMDRRMTLKQVEHLSGLSATHLSEVERGRTSPTIGALVRIARALRKDAAFFLEAEERPDVNHVLREEVGALIDVPGLKVESLSPGIPGSSMFAYRVRLDRGGEDALHLAAQDLPGDAIYHVRSGRLVVRIGETDMSLATGDTMQASLRQSQVPRTDGDATAEFYLMCTREIGATR